MDLKKTLLLATAALLLTAMPALAGKSSLELGKQLFNDPTLGGSTSGKSCNSCHANGAKLEKAAGEKHLSQVINQCITGALGGKPLDGRSVEMRSLKMYIESVVSSQK